MQKIDVKGVGLLDETQILNLVNNARKLHVENEILKEELSSLKEVSQ